MCSAAKDGRHLAELVVDAIALCKTAQERFRRTSPGRPHVYQAWQVAVLIFVAILHRRHGKSAQYRFLQQHQHLLKPVGLPKFISRASYMRRYPDSYDLYRQAIEIGGRAGLICHVGDACTVSADKSIIAARGPPGHRGKRPDDRRPKRRRGVDAEAGWGRSKHDGWTWGYCYEVVVCAAKTGVVFPLLASADAANCSEHRSFGDKIPHLPRSTRYVLGDSGYDNNRFGEAIEYDRHGRRTGRHLLTPMVRRGGKPAVGQSKCKGRRERLRQHRIRRSKFFNSRHGRRLYRRRRQTVEPFNQWLKHCFGLEERVWHRGLGNNRAMLLAVIFCYQCLQRHNAACGHRDGCVEWILDGL